MGNHCETSKSFSSAVPLPAHPGTVESKVTVVEIAPAGERSRAWVARRLSGPIIRRVTCAGTSMVRTPGNTRAISGKSTSDGETVTS